MTNNQMTENEIQQKIIENIADMAKILAKDHNCELRKDKKDGIKVIDVVRKPLKR